MLQDPETGKDFLPLVFTSKFNTLDSKLKKLADKIWNSYSDQIGDSSKLSEMMAPYILTQLIQTFDSSSYADRISSSLAFAEIVKYSNDEDLVKQTAIKMLAIITGKYF